MRQPLVEVRLWEEALADSRFFRTRYICNSANSEKIWKFSSVLSINSFASHLHNCRSGQSLQLANVRLTASSFASLNSPRWLETVTGDETGLTSHSKDSTLFSLVILRPWVLVRPGLNSVATSRSADRRLTNWANRAAALWHYVWGKRSSP